MISQTIGGIVLLPLFFLGWTCETLHQVKNSIDLIYETKELLRINPDYCVPVKNEKTIYILENDIFERANKHIHLKTGKPVYVTEKSNRLIWPME
jgi:hypothetical protein